MQLSGASFCMPIFTHLVYVMSVQILVHIRQLKIVLVNHCGFCLQNLQNKCDCKLSEISVYLNRALLLPTVGPCLRSSPGAPLYDTKALTVFVFTVLLFL